MSQITVNIGMLNQSIMQLSKLAVSCAGKKKNVQIQGGGATLTEIERMKELYDDIFNELTELVSNTEIFMKNIKTSYEVNDQNAAYQISAGM